MAKLRVEDREHASLELLATRHCECHRWRRITSHARHDIQQMFGVIRRAGAAGECEIVARPLALGAKLFRRGPDERMEPINSTGQTPERVSNEIVTAYVRQLVEQYCAPAIERP